MNIPLNIDWRQILLHLFNFVILAGGLYILLYRPIKNFMKQREDYYQGLHQDAEQVQEQARQLKEEYQAQLSQVDSAIEQKKAAAEQELDQLREQELAEARKQADAILVKAHENAEREHREMLSKAIRELTELAVTAAEKIVLDAKVDPYEQFLNLAEKEGKHEQSE